MKKINILIVDHFHVLYIHLTEIKSENVYSIQE
jgi:hypothetical protein